MINDKYKEQQDDSAGDFCFLCENCTLNALNDLSGSARYNGKENGNEQKLLLVSS